MTDPDKRRRHRPVEAAVVAQLLADLAPDGADHLLARHVADARGHCRGCELPQAGATRWPCTIHAIGTALRDQARSGRRR